jgi:hypothetical protein
MRSTLLGIVLITTVFPLEIDIYDCIVHYVMYNRIVFLVVAAILLAAIISIAPFNTKAANAQSKPITIGQSNMTGGTSQNQTGTMLGANLTGSIPIGPTMAKAIASQIHVSLANASTTAEKSVGPNAHSVAVRIGIVRGFLVYMALVHDMNTGTFHGVLVDPGTGKVLGSTTFPFSALGMMMGQGTFGQGNGMMGQGTFGQGNGMMGQDTFGQGNGMMGPGMMRGYP